MFLPIYVRVHQGKTHCKLAVAALRTPHAGTCVALELASVIVGLGGRMKSDCHIGANDMQDAAHVDRTWEGGDDGKTLHAALEVVNYSMHSRSSGGIY